MRLKPLRSLVFGMLVLMLAGCGGIPAFQQSNTTTSPFTLPTVNSSATAAASGIHHIFYIMMENHSFSQIIGNTADAPFINYLANTYGIAMNYYGVTHPSLPNYLAAISGDFQGIWDDCSAGSNVTCTPATFGSSLTLSRICKRLQSSAPV